MNLKETLKDTLKPEEISLLKRSFDVIGDVCIIEIPVELEKKEQKIAKTLLKVNKNIMTVYKKLGERKGELRLRDLKLLAGTPHITEHREHGYRLVLDVTKTYFSPREGTERQRVAKKVKENETVMVMFAGIGPFAIAIAKNQPEVDKIITVELNEDAYDFTIENIRVNKLKHKITPIRGDVRRVCHDYYNKCDRVVLPLPKGAFNFLDIAFNCLKSKGTVHLYHWSHEDDLYSEVIEIIKKECKKSKRKCKIIEKRKVLPYGPRVWKICIDFIVY